MKIGPSQDQPALNEPIKKAVDNARESSGGTSAEEQSKETRSPNQAGLTEDTVQLSKAQGTQIDPVGYDSQELRDQLAAARARGNDQVSTTGAKKEAASTKLEAVRQRIDSGFYFSKEVKEKIADILAAEFIGKLPEQEDL
ncbi:MAG: hypothetical protein OEV49_16365 [candidate division Zixibacteria bacterium]|nr:hypothetical protein [candidate division Zixibacteria bacterium]MDH3938065.1 hypothetical protein [candidate division Zixibacteria bacterium]MDH4034562.1 hypothetical protein [candidate division Zixibacteria bacterium]